MKTKYIKPTILISTIEINNLMTTASTIGLSGGNELGQNGVQFTKERNEDFSSDGYEWDTGLW